MFKKQEDSNKQQPKKEAASEIFVEVPKPQPKKEEQKKPNRQSEIDAFVKSAKALSEEDIKDGKVVVLKDCPPCCVDTICSNFRGCHHKPEMVNGDLVYPA
jgi:hypothetical protein